MLYHKQELIGAAAWRFVMDRSAIPVGQACRLESGFCLGTGVHPPSAEPPGDRIAAMIATALSPRLLHSLRLGREGRLIFLSGLSKKMLAASVVAEQLIRIAGEWRAAGHELVVDVGDAELPSLVLLDAYFEQLAELRAAGVKIHVKAFTPDVEDLAELRLGLCDILGFDLAHLHVPESPGFAFVELQYPVLHEVLCEIARGRRVELFVQGIVSAWQFSVAAGLPFSRFQGQLFESRFPGSSPAGQGSSSSGTSAGSVPILMDRLTSRDVSGLSCS